MAIIFLLISCIFLTGCISQPGTGNQTSFTQIPETPPTIGPSGTICPTMNGSPYIIINPIGNHTVGAVFEINGTTNLDMDSRIVLMVSQPPSTGLGPANGQYFLITGYVNLQKSTCGQNSWSYPVKNISGYHDSYDNYHTIYLVKILMEQNNAFINDTHFFVCSDRVQRLTDGGTS